jgi:hypothetical protein
MNQIIIPPQDMPIYGHLPIKVQQDIDRWLPVINELLALNGKGVCKAFPRLAARLSASGPKVSTGTVARKYYEIVNGDPDQALWRLLINRAKCNGGNRHIPSEFEPWWHGLVLSNKRCTKKAYEMFVRMWHAGEPIPGFPVETRGRTIPKNLGISPRNLYRKQPPRSQITLARQGIAAARKFLPHVIQDVSQVRPLEYILFDDVELDFLIVVPESLTPVKLRLLVAMDLCSRMILGYGFRPGITRPDGVEDGLKLRDMKMLVARYLRTWGTPTAYRTTLVCERGTAAIPDADKAALAEISGGQIVVSDTSMVVGQVFEFRDKATGNSFGKAWLESFFNPLHSEMGHLPGQKGRRYDLAPAELEGRKKELAMLVRAGRRIPIEMRYQFRWPFKTGAEALQELDAALHRLHNTPRELQGFDRVMLWRMNENDTWKPESELAEWPELIGRVQTDTRVETCAERFARLIADVERTEVPDCSIQRLMDEHASVRFMDYQFRFSRQGSDYVYLPSEAMIAHLEEGKNYILWFHPQDMSTVYVTRDRPHLGYIGKLTRFQQTRRGELEEAKAAIAEKTRVLSHALRAVQSTKIDTLRQRAEDIAANTEILRNVQAMEIEADVVTPGSRAVSVNAPATVRTITQDLMDRENAARRVKANERATNRAANFGRHLQESQPDESSPAAPQDETVEDWSSPATQTPETAETPIHETW